MVRRRSTVRFRNGAPLKDQVRSSLDSSILRCGWELSPYWEESGRWCSSGPTELARSAREGQPGGCRTPRRSEPGGTRWSQIRRGRPWRVLSEITCASEVAPRAAFPQYGVIFCDKWVWRFLCGAITDGDVGYPGQRMIFRRRSSLARPYRLRLMALTRQTLPSTAPEL